MKQELFDTIYHFAKTNNKQGLKALVDEGHCLHAHIKLYTPLILLAKNGEYNAVELLIDSFQGTINDAAFGYALGNHIHQLELMRQANVNEDIILPGSIIGGHITPLELETKFPEKYTKFAAGLFARGNQIKSVNSILAKEIDPRIKYEMNFQAIIGYALAENFLEMYKLILEFEGEDWDIWINIIHGYAIENCMELVGQLPIASDKDTIFSSDFLQHYLVSYAQGGHTDRVESILSSCNNEELFLKKLKSAIEGFASKGFIQQVNKIIQHYPLFKEAVEGYKGFFEMSNLYDCMKALSYTENLTLRSALAQELELLKPDTDTKVLLALSTKTHTLIQKNELSFSEALNYITLKANIFLFEWPQFAASYRLPWEIYLHILTFLANCTLKHAEEIFRAANERLRDRVVEHTKAKFLFFSNPTAIAEAENRFIRRIS